MNLSSNVQLHKTLSRINLLVIILFVVSLFAAYFCYEIEYSLQKDKILFKSFERVFTSISNETKGLFAELLILNPKSKFGIEYYDNDLVVFNDNNQIWSRLTDATEPQSLDKVEKELNNRSKRCLKLTALLKFEGCKGWPICVRNLHLVILKIFRKELQ